VLGENGRHTWEFPSRTEAREAETENLGKVVDPEPLGPCPVCKEGQVVTTEKAYVCTRALEEGSCTFNLPCELSGRKISKSEATDFITKGETEVLDGFISRKGRPFKASLVLTKKGKHRWKFPSPTKV